MEERFFTLSEVTKYLKIPKSTIYKLSQKGKIPSSKIGKQLRFRKSSLDKWLTEKEGGLKVQAQESFLIPDSEKTVEQNPKQVLLVDDDELVLKTLANFLKIYGYKVELAKDGEEALKKAEELTFDLIITDVRMPGIDGIETIKRIREIHQRKNRPAVPEIIITGYMDTPAEREAEKLGISDYIYKPFAISELLKTVKEKISFLTLFFCLVSSLAFAADTTLPTGSIKINNGASSTNTTAVTLNLSATDTGSGVSEMKFSNNNSTWTTAEPYSITKSWTLTSGSGNKTVYVKFKDASGNWSNTYSDTIVLDTTLPTGAIKINNGATSTNSTTVTLTLSASDNSSGVSQAQFSNDNSTWSPPETYSTSKSWALGPGSGTKTVYVKFKDGAGNWSTAYSDTIILDTTAPKISNVITSNITTTSASVSWNTDEPATSQVEYGLAISYGYKSSLSTTLSTSRSITISSLKQYTLYHFRVISKDSVSNQAISVDYTFTTKDTTPPTGSIKINNGASSTNTIAVTLNLSATDTGSGVSEMKFSNNNSTWTTAEPYSITKSWTLTSGSGTKTAYVKFKDASGSWSNTYSDTIVLDITPPTGKISINNNAAKTNSTHVTLTLLASDSSGIAQMQFSDDNLIWLTPEAYATTKSWTLLSGDGTKTVYVKFQDKAGNWSVAYLDTIVLDTTAPIISNVRAANIQATSAQINWDTNEPATAQVEYGLTTSYGYKSSLSSSLVTTRYITISGLKQYTLYHYRVISKDNVGNQAISGDHTFTTKDTTLPTGSIKINNGASSTNTIAVTLNLSATDTGSGVSEMKFSQNNSTWTTAEPYSITKSWTLTSGNGAKTVYARFQDNTGNWSAICSDTITLTLPVIPQVSVNSVTSPTNQNSQVISGKKSVDATEIIITSATATVGRVNIAADNTWNCALSNLKEGENIILAKARSATGTESAVVTLSIVLDIQGPAITIISPKKNEIIYE